MRAQRLWWLSGSGAVAASLTMLVLSGGVTAQQPATPPAPATAAAPASPPAGPPVNPNAAATAADHKQMLQQLGITALRPGPSGNEAAPNHANYDEALANPYPDLPDALVLKNGKKVTSADVWWKQRRPEIVADFDREVLGRVPDTRPEGDVEGQSHGTLRRRRPSGDRQGARRIGRQLGLPGYQRRHPDDGGHAGEREPARAGDDDVRRAIRHASGARRSSAAGARLWTRSWCRGRPWRSRRRAGFPRIRQPPSSSLPTGGATPRSTPPASRRTTAPGLTKGIIGLVNKGQPRKPDDWGSLRAWAWGAARGLDYLETDRGGRCEEGRHRRRVALRQGRAGDDGLRPAVRGRADRLVG